MSEVGGGSRRDTELDWRRNRDEGCHLPVTAGEERMSWNTRCRGGVKTALKKLDDFLSAAATGRVAGVGVGDGVGVGTGTGPTGPAGSKT